MSQAVYRPREPQNSFYYQCVQDHFETFEQVYEERFERQYGFFRPYIRQVIYRYLDCGDLLGKYVLRMSANSNWFATCTRIWCWIWRLWIWCCGFGTKS